jgi:oligopeptide/dipeptide ABC transporter ATP-binding protein
MAILDIRNLCVSYRTPQGNGQAVDGVTFSLEEGESLGLVGESGCGKTTAVNAILGLLPNNATIQRGEIFYKGRDLLKLSKSELRLVRGKEIAMIPQSAMNSLDPVYKIRNLMIEGMLAHKAIAAEAKTERIVELFSLVGLEGSRINDYPHMFSGGMRQRAVIAAVFSLRPSLIIADEPTTALDVIVQDQVLNQLTYLIKKTNTTMIMITHDIAIVTESCQKIGVMYAGELLEIGPIEKVLLEPFHPYTMGLQNGLLGVRGERREIISIPGVPPNLLNYPAGCRFHPRCPFGEERCTSKGPVLEEVSPGHWVACRLHAERVQKMRLAAREPGIWTRGRIS